ncbi:low molecular mass early light-inducible protein HV60, chloroplastic-like [Physcomitrium patens]|uniref:Uncharacterized protein n=1 Tax=Physcomitrium patens TaxID=3218 RepID=A0A2K1JFZ7_PHYPA|nr:low molecular mass early light-inducible protein HV60, chloroplastic-like [Physcomitrium patens]PNR40462.1 hypothetical protein PHYPA_017864 [Physcomitrium patens]PNR40464.1 hypothetical protein PHYPA_017866 [Physcomitrium patens]|eukprot:XP_024395410.1 low molecular mass early light-inducible protein HV60, chloroplastic-like [Physcomitrella patens]
MAAAAISQMSTISAGSLQASLSLLPKPGKLAGAQLVAAPARLTTSLAGRVRCEAGGSKGPLADVREAVGRNTKNVLTEDDILRNQETNESEKKSVMGTEPTSGSLYPRPEVERRTETGSKSFWSVFAFDGAAPETINGRLAMVGMVWAVVAEEMTGRTVMDQLTAPGQTGLLYFLVAVQLLTYASLVPIMSGESTDARSFGPFTARAERWNGRMAMVGFFSLLVTEMFTHSAIFN